MTLGALTLLGTGCSGDDGTPAGASGTTTTADPATQGPDTPDEAALTQAALTLNRALFGSTASVDDAAAVHGLLVASCQEEMSVDDVHRTLVDSVEERRVALGRVAEDLGVGQISLDGVDRSQGQVLVTITTHDDPDPMGWGVPMRQPWVVEDGAWRYDMCTQATTVDGATDVYSPVRIVASGMHQIAGDDDGRFAHDWAVVVTNPNPDGAAYDVAVVVRFLDAAGNEVEAVETSILDIEPGQTGAVAAVTDAKGAVRIEATARAGSWSPASSAWTLTGEVDERHVDGPPAPGMSATTRIVGSVTNTSDADLGAIPVVVFLDADGRVVGGIGSAFVKGVVTPAGSEIFTTQFPGPLPTEWTTRVYVTPAAPDYESLAALAELTGDPDLADLADHADG